jgi:hypothetical protein
MTSIILCPRCYGVIGVADPACTCTFHDDGDLVNWNGPHFVVDEQCPIHSREPLDLVKRVGK